MKSFLCAVLFAALAGCAASAPHPGILQGTPVLSGIEAGKTTREDVRKLIGEPIQVSTLPRMQREVWEYHMRANGTGGEMMFVYVQFSPDGRAREVLQMPESQVMSIFSGQSQ